MNPSTRILIKDFGPIKEAFIEFNKVTFFIGPQGAGKSTIAKLYSMFTWLEKKLIRGMEDFKEFEKTSKFKDEVCSYHRLSSFFRPSTEIKFEGQRYVFHFKNNKLNINQIDKAEQMEVYKVVYIPSDRNALSSLDSLAGLKSVPQSLMAFKDEYDNAKKSLSGINLPINNVKFSYNKHNEKTYIVGKDYKVELIDASSGFQAIVPLLLVSEHLTRLVEANIKKNNGEGLSLEESEQLKREVNAIMNDPSLSIMVKRRALSSISKRFGYAGLVNIVEEPEQNLYPESQQAVLYELLRFSQSSAGNKLIITTHSPYLIDYLTLAIKAAELIKEGANKNRIANLVPIESAISESCVNIYQLSNGFASLLPMFAGVPSDNNDLNSLLAETNTTFDELLDIEDSLR